MGIKARTTTGHRDQFKRDSRGKLRLFVSGFPVKIRLMNPKLADKEFGLLRSSPFSQNLSLDRGVFEQFVKQLNEEFREGKREYIVAETKMEGRPAIVSVYGYNVDRKNKEIYSAALIVHPAFQKQRLGFAMALERERILERKYPGYRVLSTSMQGRTDPIFEELGYSRDYEREASISPDAKGWSKTLPKRQPKK
jgi:hypothetical protein